MYPEYLDVWNDSVAGYQRPFASPRARLRQAGQVYAQAHGLELLDPTPFSDTEAIGVTRAYASQHDLRTLADLRRVATTLTLGAPPQFQQSPTGLPAIEQAYGFAPAALQAARDRRQYQALDPGTVQAADVNTTDGQLDNRDYRLLRTPNACSARATSCRSSRQKVLAAEGPAFQATIEPVSALLTQPVMRRLNAAVDIYHQDPAAVAKQFLQAHGLVSARRPLESSGPQPLEPKPPAPRSDTGQRRPPPAPPGSRS